MCPWDLLESSGVRGICKFRILRDALSVCFLKKKLLNEFIILDADLEVNNVLVARHLRADLGAEDPAEALRDRVRAGPGLKDTVTEQPYQPYFRSGQTQSKFCQNLAKIVRIYKKIKNF